MKPARILVTDSSRASALAVIRSLGRAGHHVVAADPSPRPVGARSRYCRGSVAYPSPFDRPAVDTARAIGDAARHHGIDLVVPVTDEVLVSLHEHPEHLPPDVRLAAAPVDAVGIAASKVATHELARSLAVPAPRSVVVRHEDEVTGVLGVLGSPVVVKPDRSRVIGPDGLMRRGQVSYARSEDDVRVALATAGQPVLVQQLHRGAGHGIGLVLQQGRPLLAVQHRRLHEVPVSGGASALRETVPLDRELLDQSVALLSSLRWDGAAMVEFKVGSGGSKLMEINGRLWGSLPLAVRAGADVPALAATVHLQRPDHLPTLPIDGYAPFVRARNLNLELVWIGSVLAHRGRSDVAPDRPRREALTALVDLGRTGQGDDLMASDDLRPALAGVGAAALHAVRKVVNHG